VGFGENIFKKDSIETESSNQSIKMFSVFDEDDEENNLDLMKFC
jgi:hypothetical protein